MVERQRLQLDIVSNVSTGGTEDRVDLVDESFSKRNP